MSEMGEAAPPPSAIAPGSCLRASTPSPAETLTFSSLSTITSGAIYRIVPTPGVLVHSRRACDDPPEPPEGVPKGKCLLMPKSAIFAW